jgi:hypothetical protein
VQFGAGECPDGVDGFIARESQRSVGGEGIDEAAKVVAPIGVKAGEELGELGLAS